MNNERKRKARVSRAVETGTSNNEWDCDEARTSNNEWEYDGSPLCEKAQRHFLS